MFEYKADAAWRAIPLAVSLCALAWATPALSQSAIDSAAPSEKKSDLRRAAVSTTKPTSPNATVNLVNLLVQQGVLKEEQAEALIKQAENEAYVSRQAAKDATVKADEAARAASAASGGVAAGNPPRDLRAGNCQTAVTRRD